MGVSRKLRILHVSAVVAALLATACGGGGGSASDGDDPSPNGTAEPTGAATSDEEPTGEQPTSGDPDVIRVGVAAPISEHLLVWMGEELGIYDEYNLDVQPQLIPGGPEIVAGISGGSLDFGIFAAPGPQNAAAQGANIRVVAEWVSVPNLEFVVTDEIQDPSDFQGKSIAVSAPGTTTALLTESFLMENGLELGTDVVARNVGGQGEALSAFVSGQVDGAIFGSPVSDTALAQTEGSHVMVDYTEDYLWPYAVLAGGSFPENNPDATVRFISAIRDIVAAFPNEEDVAVEVITRESGIEDEELIRSAVQRATSLFSTDLTPRADSHEAVLEIMRATGDQEFEGMTAEDLIDTTWVDQLEDLSGQ